MDSIIELQRQTHEEIERYERALYTVLSRSQNVHHGRVQNDHKASQILDRISSRNTTLHSTYRDQDARNVEIDAISTPNQPGDLSEFYARLGKIQEHHNKYPDAGADGVEFDIAALLDEYNPEDYDDDEYVYEDRESLRTFRFPIPTHSRPFKLWQTCSPEKSRMENTSTYMRIIPPITI
jgi:splicing factor 3A subunit 3